MCFDLLALASEGDVRKDIARLQAVSTLESAQRGCLVALLGTS